MALLLHISVWYFDHLQVAGVCIVSGTWWDRSLGGIGGKTMDQSMEQFYLFGLAALIACTLKIVILSMVISRTKLASAFNLICIALITQNALEFLSAFTYAANPEVATYFLDGLMFSLYASAAALVYFSLTVAQVKFIRPLSTLFLLFAVAIGGLHATGYIVDGYIPLGYTIISNEGVLYPAFEAFILAVIAVSIGTLFMGRRSNNQEIQSRSKTALLAIAPICLLGVGVIALRIIGFNSSSGIFMPLATTFFVWILMLDQRGEFVTFNVKWRIIWKLATNIKSLKLADWAGEVEKQLVLEAMRTKNNNKSAAAKLVGSNQTTFHRKAEKHMQTPARHRAAA